MMDKDFSPAPLDDQDLNALFEAAQRAVHGRRVERRVAWG